MANRIHAIKFLENYDLRNRILNIEAEASPSLLDELKCIEGLELTDAQPDLGFYRMLSAEYERYLQEEYLDNISLVITGIDNTTFSWDNGKHLISEACRRIESSPFGSQMNFYEVDSKIYVLWFPTTLVSFGEFDSKQVEEIRLNVYNYWVNVLGLIVKDVSFSIIDGGGGREDQFYDYYFLPRKIADIFNGAESILPSYEPDGEKTVMGYFREDNDLENLKAAVKNQLPTPLGFDINLPDMFEASAHTCFFMPTFRVGLKVQSGQSASEIIKSVKTHFDVLESMVFDGHIYLECMSAEGPYANTVSDIVKNIEGILSPFVIPVLRNLSLDVFSVQFILTYTER